MLLEFAPLAGRLEVPDPYYGASNGFEHVLDLVEEAAVGVLEHLRNTQPPNPAPDSPSAAPDTQPRETARLIDRARCEAAARLSSRSRAVVAALRPARRCAPAVGAPAPLRSMARLLGCTRARVRARELLPFDGLGAIARLGCPNLARLGQPLAGLLRLGRPFLARLRRTFASLARLGGPSRLDPVRLPVRRLLAYRVDGRRARSRLGDRILHTLDWGLVRARGVVATVRGSCGRGWRRLPAVHALCASRVWLLALPPVVAAAAAASAPATPAALALALLAWLLLIVGPRLSALALWLRVALCLARGMLLAVVASSFLRRPIAAVSRLAHWPLAAVTVLAHRPLPAAVALRPRAAVATASAALPSLLAMGARFAVAVAPAWVIAVHAAARALLVARGGGGRLLGCRWRRRG